MYDTICIEGYILDFVRCPGASQFHPDWLHKACMMGFLTGRLSSSAEFLDALNRKPWSDYIATITSQALTANTMSITSGNIGDIIAIGKVA
jgi:hypothetical protein